MSIQSPIMLMGSEISVTLRDQGMFDRGALGSAHYATSTIELSEGQSKAVEQTTLLHELTHIMLDAHQVELSETGIDVIAHGYRSLIRDNAEMIAEVFWGLQLVAEEDDLSEEDEVSS